MNVAAVVQHGFTIGQVWGVPIKLHSSWFLVFALIAWSLAAGYFPAGYPGWALPTYWIVGGVTSALFFGCILVHELGHAWVAMRHALPVRSITLFVFGGIARIGREPSSPATELRIAAAGPLTSLGLGIVFGGLAFIARDIDVVGAPAVYLARINAMIAIFNVFPGFPLDGGRLLRALLWHRTGDFDRSTATAALVGHLLASLMITVGLLAVVWQHTIEGVWMLLVGWFLQSAAASTRAQATLRTLLRGVKVSQVMARECPRVDSRWTLDRVVEHEVLGAGHRYFFVSDNGCPRGLLTVHEVSEVPRGRWSATTVEDAMTSIATLTPVGPDDDLIVALETMDDAEVAEIPVVADDRVLGMIEREQILSYVRSRAELGL